MYHDDYLKIELASSFVINLAGTLNMATVNNDSFACFETVLSLLFSIKAGRKCYVFSRERKKSIVLRRVLLHFVSRFFRFYAISFSPPSWTMDIGQWTMDMPCHAPTVYRYRCPSVNI